MADCEEPSCNIVQSGVCLHCNKRLCAVHIVMHGKALLPDVIDLIQKTNEFDQQMIAILETGFEACDHAETECNTWRTIALEKINQLFTEKMKKIENQRLYLNKRKDDLTKQLSLNVRQPLEKMQEQQIGNVQVLDSVRSVLQHIKHDSASLEKKQELSLNLPRKLKIIDVSKNKVQKNSPSAQEDNAGNYSFQ
ncbi:unnamed protein product [Rotaria sp. Silwood1]|nr:unnamed protein product [Rotaria sp. Silwood1]